MKKLFIYFVVGFFNTHSFCTEVYGAGEQSKAALPIIEQLKNAIQKRTSEVASLNNKNKLNNLSNNVIKLKKLKDFVKKELLDNIDIDIDNVQFINSIKDLNEALKPNYTPSYKELSRILEEAGEQLLKVKNPRPQVNTERISPPEKKKLIEEMKGLKEKASAQEIALRKNPSKKFDPKILQQVNANLLAKVSEVEILYSKKDPKLTDERILQTLLLAQTAQKLMEGISNINKILSGVEEKRAALSMAKKHFSKYDSDQNVYELLQNIDEKLEKLKEFDQDNASGENENTFALKNKIEALGNELYGKSMGFDRSEKENKEYLLKASDEIDQKLSVNKKFWDQNSFDIESLIKEVNQKSEDLMEEVNQKSEDLMEEVNQKSENLRQKKKGELILKRSKDTVARLTADKESFQGQRFDEIKKALEDRQGILENRTIDSVEQ